MPERRARRRQSSHRSCDGVFSRDVRHAYATNASENTQSQTLSVVGLLPSIAAVVCVVERSATPPTESPSSMVSPRGRDEVAWEKRTINPRPSQMSGVYHYPTLVCLPRVALPTPRWSAMRATVGFTLSRRRRQGLRTRISTSAWPSHDTWDGRVAMYLPLHTRVPVHRACFRGASAQRDATAAEVSARSQGALVSGAPAGWITHTVGNSESGNEGSTARPQQTRTTSTSTIEPIDSPARFRSVEDACHAAA